MYNIIIREVAPPLFDAGTPTSASSPAEASGSSLAQSGGFSPELDIPLSPIPKTPTSAVQAVHVQEPTLASMQYYVGRIILCCDSI